MIRILRSLSVGFLLGWLLLAALGLDGGVPGWWLATALAVAISSIILSTVVRSLAAAGGSVLRLAPSDDAIATAEREGRLHLARVLDISSTGTQINDNPVAELRLVVAPSTRSAYSTRTRALIDQVRLPQFQPGNVVVVLQEKADQPAVTLVQSPPQSWRDRAANDTRVGRMDHAPEWAQEATSTRDARGILRIPAVVLVLLLVVGFAARLYPVRAELTEILAGASPSEVADARTLRLERAESTLDPARAQEVIDDLVAEAGHTRFTKVNLGSTTATGTVPTTPDADTTDEISWRDGKVTAREPSLIQPSGGELPLQTFDAADVDWAGLQELADRLPQQGGFELDDAPSVTVSVPSRASAEDGLPYQISVWGSGAYHDASVTYDPDGNVIGMNGGAAGSEIAAWVAERQG
ncbi:hypothetical protein [Promicromonospora sp. NPDC060271]|uniref:hypothetical protein n=1 Tax=Promicromonospora sp. NPDC060271 TaxID=3347089 RepID=UPI0036644F04